MNGNLTNPRFLCILIVIVFIFRAEWAIAGDSKYQHLTLQEGISIEVPSHWFLHDDADKNNFAAAGEGAARSSGDEYDTTESKSRLLAISALPIPSGAKIRVNVIRPLTFFGAELRAATAQDIKDIKASYSSALAKTMPLIGSSLISLKTPQVESIKGNAALLIEYRRSDPSGGSPWTVRLYRIPAGDKLIELTTSFRESDAKVWKPILEYVKQSLHF